MAEPFSLPAQIILNCFRAVELYVLTYNCVRIVRTGVEIHQNYAISKSLLATVQKPTAVATEDVSNAIKNFLNPVKLSGRTCANPSHLLTPQTPLQMCPTTFDACLPPADTFMKGSSFVSNSSTATQSVFEIFAQAPLDRQAAVVFFILFVLVAVFYGPLYYLFESFPRPRAVRGDKQPLAFSGIYVPGLDPNLRAEEKAAFADDAAIQSYTAYLDLPDQAAAAAAAIDTTPEQVAMSSLSVSPLQLLITAICTEASDNATFKKLSCTFSARHQKYFNSRLVRATDDITKKAAGVVVAFWKNVNQKLLAVEKSVKVYTDEHLAEASSSISELLSSRMDTEFERLAKEQQDSSSALKATLATKAELRKSNNAIDERLEKFVEKRRNADAATKQQVSEQLEQRLVEERGTNHATLRTLLDDGFVYQSEMIKTTIDALVKGEVVKIRETSDTVVRDQVEEALGKPRAVSQIAVTALIDARLVQKDVISKHAAENLVQEEVARQTEVSNAHWREELARQLEASDALSQGELARRLEAADARSKRKFAEEREKSSAAAKELVTQAITNFGKILKSELRDEFEKTTATKEENLRLKLEENLALQKSRYEAESRQQGKELEEICAKKVKTAEDRIEAILAKQRRELEDECAKKVQAAKEEVTFNLTIQRKELEEDYTNKVIAAKRESKESLAKHRKELEAEFTGITSNLTDQHKELEGNSSRQEKDLKDLGVKVERTCENLRDESAGKTQCLENRIATDISQLKDGFQGTIVSVLEKRQPYQDNKISSAISKAVNGECAAREDEAAQFRKELQSNTCGLANLQDNIDATRRDLSEMNAKLKNKANKVNVSQQQQLSSSSQSIPAQEVYTVDKNAQIAFPWLRLDQILTIADVLGAVLYLRKELLDQEQRTSSTFSQIHDTTHQLSNKTHQLNLDRIKVFEAFGLGGYQATHPLLATSATVSDQTAHKSSQSPALALSTGLVTQQPLPEPLYRPWIPGLRLSNLPWPIQSSIAEPSGTTSTTSSPPIDVSTSELSDQLLKIDLNAVPKFSKKPPAKQRVNFGKQVSAKAQFYKHSLQSHAGVDGSRRRARSFSGERSELFEADRIPTIVFDRSFAALNVDLFATPHANADCAAVSNGSSAQKQTLSTKEIVTLKKVPYVKILDIKQICELRNFLLIIVGKVRPSAGFWKQNEDRESKKTHYETWVEFSSVPHNEIKASATSNQRALRGLAVSWREKFIAESLDESFNNTNLAEGESILSNDSPTPPDNFSTTVTVVDDPSPSPTLSHQVSPKPSTPEKHIKDAVELVGEEMTEAEKEQIGRKALWAVIDNHSTGGMNASIFAKPKQTPSFKKQPKPIINTDWQNSEYISAASAPLTQPRPSNAVENATDGMRNGNYAASKVAADEKPVDRSIGQPNNSGTTDLPASATLTSINGSSTATPAYPSTASKAAVESASIQPINGPQPVLVTSTVPEELVEQKQVRLANLKGTAGMTPFKGADTGFATAPAHQDHSSAVESDPKDTRNKTGISTSSSPNPAGLKTIIESGLVELVNPPQHVPVTPHVPEETIDEKIVRQLNGTAVMTPFQSVAGPAADLVSGGPEPAAVNSSSTSIKPSAELKPKTLISSKWETPASKLQNTKEQANNTHTSSAPHQNVGNASTSKQPSLAAAPKTGSSALATSRYANNDIASSKTTPPSSEPKITTTNLQTSKPRPATNGQGNISSSPATTPRNAPRSDSNALQRPGWAVQQPPTNGHQDATNNHNGNNNNNNNNRGQNNRGGRGRGRGGSGGGEHAGSRKPKHSSPGLERILRENAEREAKAKKGDA